MKDFVYRRGGSMAPIGYFVHHQGRGHAERCAAIVNALPPERPVTLFSARDDIFPKLRAGVEIRKIPSLFEPSGAESLNDVTTMPDTVHCAPLGWPGIRTAMAEIATWFHKADPALMICDVSAEIAQLSRICSVPHVKVLQHGQRNDPGHRAAYDGAVGLLAPCHETLAQTDWSDAMRRKTHFAGGIGVSTEQACRDSARRRLGVADDRRMVLVISGGGGDGFPSAPLGVGARALPDAQWITIGNIRTDWHATEPGNLRHDGWIENVADYLAAADVVVASTGNTTCHQILAHEKPWIAVPEWRYFDEQVEKARALHRVGAAYHVSHLPSSVQAWRDAVSGACRDHYPRLQASLVNPDAAKHCAEWIEGIVARLHGLPVDASKAATNKNELRLGATHDI